MTKKGKGSPYSITERRVPELIPVLGSQPTGDVSHKPGSRLPLLSARFGDYKPGIEVTTIAEALSDVLDDIKTFVTDQLGMSHQRKDYQELIQLVLVFIGGVPSPDLAFRKPGAIHCARFMLRLLYSPKIYIFRDAGFKMTDREIRSLGEFCVFGIAAYTKPWFLSRLPTAAPANDLKLLKLLVSSTSPAFVGALKKLCRQLWYLSEELTAFAFLTKTLKQLRK